MECLTDIAVISPYLRVDHVHDSVVGGADVSIEYVQIVRLDDEENTAQESESSTGAANGDKSIVAAHVEDDVLGQLGSELGFTGRRRAATSRWFDLSAEADGGRHFAHAVRLGHSVLRRLQKGQRCWHHRTRGVRHLALPLHQPLHRPLQGLYVINRFVHDC